MPDNQTTIKIYELPSDTSGQNALVFAPSDAGINHAQMQIKRLGIIAEDEIAKRLGVEGKGQGEPSRD